MLLDSLSVRDLQLGSVASDPAHKRGLQFVTVYTRVAPLLAVLFGAALALNYQDWPATGLHIHSLASKPSDKQQDGSLEQARRQLLNHDTDIWKQERPHNLLDPNHLSWGNLFHDTQMEQFFGNADAMIAMLLVMFFTIIALLAVVNVLSLYVLPRMVPQYKELDVFGQLSVTTNTTYSLLLILQLVPYTVLMVGVLFGDSEAKDYPNYAYAVFIFLTTHAVMYAYEAIVRGIVKVNYLLLIHHAGFFIFCIIDFIIKSNFVVKIALIFDYFVCWEAALYYTTVLYRLRAEYHFLKIVLLTGTIVHGVTHFIQAMLLTAFFVGMGQRMKVHEIHVGIFVMMVILSYALIAYQFYLEKIFYLMWLKIAARNKKDKERAKATSDADNAEQGNKVHPAESTQASDESRAGSSDGRAQVSAAGCRPAAGKTAYERDNLTKDDWEQCED